MQKHLLIPYNFNLESKLAVKSALRLFGDSHLRLDLIHFKDENKGSKRVLDLELKRIITSNDLDRVEYTYREESSISDFKVNRLLASERYDMMIIGLEETLLLPSAYEELTCPILRIGTKNQFNQIDQLIYIGDAEALESLHGFDLVRSIAREQQTELQIWQLQKERISSGRMNMVNEYFYEFAPEIKWKTKEEALLIINEIIGDEGQKTMLICNCKESNEFMRNLQSQIPVVSYNKHNINLVL